MILPLSLLWYVSALLLERFGKQRVTPIIRPGKSELEADVMGGGFPTMYQARGSAEPRIIATTLIAQHLLHGLVAIPW